MADKIYVNQALTLDLTYKDEDGAAIDISGGNVTADLFAPSNRTSTASVTISGSIVSGAAGTATITIAMNTLNEKGQWRVQPLVTLSGTEWPGDVQEIAVIARGSM